MNVWIKLAFKELRAHRGFSLFFILNLTLGLVGFLMLDSFKVSLQDYFDSRSKAILTADLGIYASRPFRPKELQIVESVLGKNCREADQTVFFYMVASEGHSRMVQIVGISQNFPFYGDLILSRQGRVTPRLVQRNLYDSRSVWIFPELMAELGVAGGGSIKIGNASYRIADTVVEEPAGAINTFGMAPKVYMAADQIQKTGLIKPGSRVQYYRYYKFLQAVNLQALALALRERLQAEFGSGHDVRIITPQDAGRRVGRSLVYINDYLGLTALVALFLAAIGTAYLFRSYFTGRLKEVAILMALGARRKDALKVLVLQVVILGLLAAVIANTLAVVMVPLLPALLKEFLPKGFEILLRPGSFFLATFMGTLGSLLFCLPVLVNIREVEPLSLFHQTGTMTRLGANSTRPIRNMLIYAPGLSAYWGLALWQARSFVVGSMFVGLFLGAAVVSGAVAWLMLAGLGRFTFKGVILRLAFRNLCRNKVSVVAGFLAISLGSLLLNLIPQLHSGLKEEISLPEGRTLPAFFLFDIQPEQLEPLQAYMRRLGHPLQHPTPIIRARLDRINGRVISEAAGKNAATREQEAARRLRRRGINLTYKIGSYPPEDIVEGRPTGGRFNLKSNQPPEISVEIRYAGRLGYRLGDILHFDVQGVEVAGKIVNLRRVKWNTFQPNFYIQFQPGVLEDAPKSFLASVSEISAEQKQHLQNGIVDLFPNISMLDVTRVVERFLQLAGQLSLALQFMAVLSIVAGLVVVFSIARNEAQTRIREINLLKVLGGSFQKIRNIFLVEFGVVGGSSAFCGVILSFVVSYVIGKVVFESVWHFSWQFGLASIGIIGVISMLTTLAATQQVLRKNPLDLLQAV